MAEQRVSQAASSSQVTSLRRSGWLTRRRNCLTWKALQAVASPHVQIATGKLGRRYRIGQGAEARALSRPNLLLHDNALRLEIRPTRQPQHHPRLTYATVAPQQGFGLRTNLSRQQPIRHSPMTSGNPHALTRPQTLQAP